MRRVLVYILFFFSLSTAYARTSDEQVIRELLDRQVTEWNRGRIEGYMKGYWEDERLLFIGSKGPRYGYEATLNKYKEAYPDAAHMGQLTTTISSVQRLSPKYYFVVGTWALKRMAGDVSGSFTLLFHKINKNWVIVVDHSS